VNKPNYGVLKVAATAPETTQIILQVGSAALVTGAVPSEVQ
jgi:hypothetical protein